MKTMKSFCLMIIALMLMPMTANASREETVIDGIKYSIDTDNKTAEVKKNDILYSGEVVIPETIVYDGVTYSVTSIGDDAFSYCMELTSVTIPNSVTRIGDDAFFICLALTSVTGGNSVTTIGKNAFASCIKLPSVTIPSTVTSIGEAAFYNMNALTDVYCFAESVPSTHSNAFGENNLQTVTLHVPEGLGSVYGNAAPWSRFGTIVEMKKCATPTIAYANGILRFTCETEGVEYVSNVSCTPTKLQDGNEMKIGGTFTISVYAKKVGFYDSEVVTKTIDMGQMGDMDGDGDVTVSDITSLVNVILGK